MPKLLRPCCFASMLRGGIASTHAHTGCTSYCSLERVLALYPQALQAALINVWKGQIVLWKRQRHSTVMLALCSGPTSETVMWGFMEGCVLLGGIELGHNGLNAFMTHHDVLGAQSTRALAVRASSHRSSARLQG